MQCYLRKQFEMKDLGRPTQLLYGSWGIIFVRCILHISRKIFLWSLSSIWYHWICSSSTPLDSSIRLTSFDGVPLEDPTLYWQFVGSLIYLTVTRPDIAHVVHIVSQFMVAPRTIHDIVVLYILQYVKVTLGHGIQFFSKSSLVIFEYTGADWLVI